MTHKKSSFFFCALIIISIVSGCLIKEQKQENIKEIKFVVIGDPHIKSHNEIDGGNERLSQIINKVNQLDIDFVVFLGDITDDGKNKTFELTKKILINMTKPYYVVAGNHDILVSPKNFAQNWPMEHTEIVKGYQLIFIGISNETVNDKVKLSWLFNFSNADTNIPTIVFLHGPTIGPPSDCTNCNWGEFFGYGMTIKPELDKFQNLIAVFSGHVHYNSDQTFNGVRHITLNGLVKKNAGGISATPSDKIGYSIIENRKLNYSLIKYQ